MTGARGVKQTKNAIFLILNNGYTLCSRSSKSFSVHCIQIATLREIFPHSAAV